MIFKPAMAYTTAYIGEDLGLLDVNTGKYYVLNPIGAQIWDIIVQKPSSVEEIADILESLYEGEREDILTDIQEYLMDLAEKGLVLSDA